MIPPVRWFLSVALYGMGCMGMAAPEQLMECCERMHGYRHSHCNQNPQGCCKVTPHMHPALGRPSSAQAISFSPVKLGVVKAFDGSKIPELLAGSLAGHSHDPPPTCSAPFPPLRI